MNRHGKRRIETSSNETQLRHLLEMERRMATQWFEIAKLAWAAALLLLGKLLEH